MSGNKKHRKTKTGATGEHRHHIDMFIEAGGGYEGPSLIICCLKSAFYYDHYDRSNHCGMAKLFQCLMLHLGRGVSRVKYFICCLFVNDRCGFRSLCD